jgi:hypothetical protein
VGKELYDERRKQKGLSSVETSAGSTPLKVKIVCELSNELLRYLSIFEYQEA